MQILNDREEVQIISRFKLKPFEIQDILKAGFKFQKNVECSYDVHPAFRNEPDTIHIILPQPCRSITSMNEAIIVTDNVLAMVMNNRKHNAGHMEVIPHERHPNLFIIEGKEIVHYKVFHHPLKLTDAHTFLVCKPKETTFEEMELKFIDSNVAGVFTNMRLAIEGLKYKRDKEDREFQMMIAVAEEDL
jgi:hypothetical protein